MKQILRQQVYKIILSGLLLIMTAVLFAQETPGGVGGGFGGLDNPGGPIGGGVPIDGGLVLLLTAGVGYGMKKAYHYRKGQNSNAKD